MTTIRRAIAHDTPRLLEMAVRFLNETEYADHVTPNPERIAKTVAYLLEAGAAFVAITDTGAIVGMVGFILVPSIVSDDLVANEIAWWMEPEYRHTSVGPRLLGAGMEWARSQLATVIQMIAPVGARASLAAWYERLGFNELETTYQLRLT